MAVELSTVKVAEREAIELGEDELRSIELAD